MIRKKSGPGEVLVSRTPNPTPIPSEAAAPPLPPHPPTPFPISGLSAAEIWRRAWCSGGSKGGLRPGSGKADRVGTFSLSLPPWSPGTRSYGEHGHRMLLIWPHSVVTTPPERYSRASWPLAGGTWRESASFSSASCSGQLWAPARPCCSAARPSKAAQTTVP